jgi:hypothetical protein
MYVVSKILGARYIIQKMFHELLVAWRGFPVGEATWETHPVMTLDIPEIVFCRPDQCSRNSDVDDNSCLISELLAFFILHDVFASRHLHLRMLTSDYTVPTRCRHRGEIVDPPGCKACRAIRQPISHQINYLITRSKIIQTQSVFCHQALHRDRVTRL